VGPLTALATVLVLGPVTRFATHKHVVSYIGLAPAVAASAEKCRLGHITKQGNALLRYVLGQAGQVAARSDPDLRRLYLMVMHRHGRPKAKVAVARKLLIRLSIILRDQIDYAEFRDRGRPPSTISGSSTIEHDIMRRGAGANRWIVDSCCPEDRAVGCTPTRETAMLR